MVRTAIIVLPVWFFLAAGGCQKRPNSAVAADGTQIGTIEGALTADGVTSSAVAALDQVTSASRLRVPKQSLAALAESEFVIPRRRMVEYDIRGLVRDGRDPVRDERVIQAMRLVPRHEFVPPAQHSNAYADHPLPIGHGQTISQPYIVALMTELVKPGPDHRILEVGTGSGYQAAVLGVLANEVYTIEIVEPLGKRAGQTLKRLGYDNVHVRVGDGYRGWPEKAPFDGVIVTAAPEVIPKPLLEQLKVGGRLVIPVGPVGGYQELKVVRKTEQGIVEDFVTGVRFVPMVGEVEKEKRR